MSVTSVALTADKVVANFSAGQNGEIVRTYRVCYCIAFDDVCDGPLQLINEAIALGLPDFRSFYVYKGEVDLGAFVNSIEPVATTGEGNCFECIVCINYSSDWPDDQKDENGEPAETPEDIAKQVEIDFVEYQKPGDQFLFKGYCLGDGTDITADIDEAVLQVGSVGPIRNSAGCAQLRNILCYKHILRVRNYVSSWDCQWDDCLGFWNDAPFYIVEGDQNGITFFCPYPSCTLQLVDISKTNRRQNGLLYYCIDWVLSYDPNGFETKILDAGTQAAFLEGLQDPRLGKVSPSASFFNVVGPDDDRLCRSPSGKREILDSSGNPVTSPVLLNGEGVKQYIINGGQHDAPIFLRYCEAEVTGLGPNPTIEPKKKDLSVLPICPQP